jgi:hypothetical protein
MMKSMLYCFLGVVTLLYGTFPLIFGITLGLFYVREVYGPSIEFPVDRRGKVGLSDLCRPSTDDLHDLIVDQNVTDERAADIVRQHGTAFVPGVLTKDTAEKLRDFVMEENKKLGDTQVDVLEKENRFNLILDATDLVVQAALKQVGEHPKLRPLIDRTLGPGASLVNLSVLTAKYGAEAQGIHPDTSTSAASYPRLFVKEYTLVIALQDTTNEMGATHLCPGTQNCSSIADEEEEDKRGTGDAPICKVRAVVNQGDGFIYHSDLFHRGTAHLEPNAPERAFLFLIFAESRRGPLDKRILPFGEVRALKWSQWGLIIDEFPTIQHHARRWWRSLGLFSRNSAGVRPWNFFDYILTIFENSVNGVAHSISNDFGKDAFGVMVNRAMLLTFIFFVALVYLGLSLVLLLGWYFLITSSDGTSASGELDQNQVRRVSLSTKKKTQ